MLALTVTAAFANYERGAQITDPALIEATLASANAVNVVRAILPDQASPPASTEDPSQPA